MERQLVAPSVDQWRAVRRSITTQETTYKPGPEFFGYRPRNRQLLHITSSEPNDQGFYPAKWVQSDVGDQTHNDQNDVWAWPVDAAASDGQYLDGENVGELDGVPIFRGFISGGGNYPNILNVVTNVCKIGESSEVVFDAGTDNEIDSESGRAVIAGSYEAKKGPATFKATVLWKDPDFLASTGDVFDFYLNVNGTNYTGAPEYIVTFIGDSAKITKEMSWTVDFQANETVGVLLVTRRTSGNQPLTVDAATKLVINGGDAGNKVQFQPIAADMVIGRKICITNPRNCCDDDDSSTASRDTASRSPYPLIWGAAGEITCPNIMAWKGLAESGTLYSASASVPKRFKVTLPTFTPYQVTQADYNYSPPYQGYEYPPCAQEIADYLTGRQVILEAEFDGTHATFLNPGTCGYSASETLVLPSFQYQLGEVTQEIPWVLNLVYTIRWAIVEMYTNGSGEYDLPPLKRITVGVVGDSWTGQNTLGAGQWKQTTSYFFDGSLIFPEANMTGKAGPANMPWGVPANPNVYLVPRDPEEWYLLPYDPLGDHFPYAAVKVEGPFTMEPY